MRVTPYDQQIRLQTLIEMEIDRRLPPEQRLLLAILQQAVVDYFGKDPVESESAADYFAASPLYRLTLATFNLPEDTLPEDVDPAFIQMRREQLSAVNTPESLQMEGLVRRLSGNQLKVVLTMGLLPLPATAGKIAAACQISRTTVLSALNQLADQKLVERLDDGHFQFWSLPETVMKLLDEVWG